MMTSWSVTVSLANLKYPRVSLDPGPAWYLMLCSHLEQRDRHQAEPDSVAAPVSV